MKFFPPRARIAMGLTGAVVGILFLANLFGILPSPEQERMKGRAQLCESVALSSSALIARGDEDGLSLLLRGVVDRNDDVVSAGVRRANGELTITAGLHEESWSELADGRSTQEQMQVPIYKGPQRKMG